METRVADLCDMLNTAIDRIVWALERIPFVRADSANKKEAGRMMVEAVRLLASARNLLRMS